MKLSIVTTLYASAAHIVDFLKQLEATLARFSEQVPGSQFEIIVVNDGSPDDSLNLTTNFAKNSRFAAAFKIVDLSRNFGHHYAIMAGLGQATGDYTFLIDCDLEEPVDSLLTFWDKLKKSGADSVYGIVKQRRGRVIKKFGGVFFYWFFNKISDVRMPPNVATVRLMSKRYVAALNEFKERQLVFVGLCVLAGFRQETCEIDKTPRRKTSYSFGKRLAMAVNTTVSLTSRPLYLVFFFGLFVTMAAVGIMARVLIHRFMFGTPVDGWTSLIISIWMVGGILIFCVGLIGIYLSKVFIEVKQRPNVIIKEIEKLGQS